MTALRDQTEIAPSLTRPVASLLVDSLPVAAHRQLLPSQQPTLVATHPARPSYMQQRARRTVGTVVYVYTIFSSISKCYINLLSESNQEFSWLVAIEAKFGTFEASFYVQLPFRKVS